MLPIASFHDDAFAHVIDAVTGNSVWEMGLRAALVYIFALVLVRRGKSRMLSQATVFDIILMFVLGSTLSRVINGSSPLLPSAVAAIVLVALHYLLGWSAFHTRFGAAVKGTSNVLIRDGEVVDDALHEHHLTHHDLEEALYLKGLTDLEDVKLARLERNGDISIVRKTRIYEIEVKDGVQRVRLEV